MEERIIEYLKRYCEEEDIKKNVEMCGEKRTIIKAMRVVLEGIGLKEDYIRKEISVYIGRIISEEEFKRMREWGLVPC